LLVLSSPSSMLTQKEIQSLTGLSVRSVKGSLRLLKEMNLVREFFVLDDMRCKLYHLGGVS
jgi:DNA-binding MarR family transcriptional regulator